MRWYWWLFWALIVYWIVQDPTSAANLLRGIGGGLSHAAHSFSILMSNL